LRKKGAISNGFADLREDRSGKTGAPH